VCGRRIPELSLRKTTCSDFCRSRYKSGYTPYKNCKEAPFDDLTLLQQKAHEAGMSYGKYMAMKYGKENNDEKRKKTHEGTKNADDKAETRL
jgi:hypothetical protein